VKVKHISQKTQVEIWQI